MAEPALELDRPVERLPGYREYEARNAIRELLSEYGAGKTELILSAILEDERLRMKK